MNCTSRKGWLICGGVFSAGTLVGIVIIGLAAWMLMPSMMLTVHESPYSIDETCTRLTESIEANGWSSPAVRNMNNAMSKEGVQMESPVRIVELCKAEYAREVLQSNPEVATLMPCAFAVYENQGKVYVSGMNTGLMGKMFGGTIAEVMGGRVSADEARILSCLE